MYILWFFRFFGVCSRSNLNDFWEVCSSYVLERISIDGRNTDLRDRENKHLHSCSPGAGTPLGGPVRGSNLSLFLFCIFYTRNVFLYQFTVRISPILTPRILFPRRRKHLRCSPTVSHFESHSVLYLPRDNVFLIPIYKRNTMIIYPNFFHIEGWDGG